MVKIIHQPGGRLTDISKPRPSREESAFGGIGRPSTREGGIIGAPPSPVKPQTPFEKKKEELALKQAEARLSTGKKLSSKEIVSLGKAGKLSETELQKFASEGKIKITKLSETGKLGEEPIDRVAEVKGQLAETLKQYKQESFLLKTPSGKQVRVTRERIPSFYESYYPGEPIPTELVEEYKPPSGQRTLAEKSYAKIEEVTKKYPTIKKIVESIGTFGGTAKEKQEIKKLQLKLEELSKKLPKQSLREKLGVKTLKEIWETPAIKGLRGRTGTFEYAEEADKPIRTEQKRLLESAEKSLELLKEKPSYKMVRPIKWLPEQKLETKAGLKKKYYTAQKLSAELGLGLTGVSTIIRKRPDYLLYAWGGGRAVGLVGKLAAKRLATNIAYKGVSAYATGSYGLGILKEVESASGVSGKTEAITGEAIKGLLFAKGMKGGFKTPKVEEEPTFKFNKRIKDIADFKKYELKNKEYIRDILIERGIEARKKQKPIDLSKIKILPEISKIDTIIKQTENLERLGTSLETKAMIKSGTTLKVLRPTKLGTPASKLFKDLYELKKAPKIKDLLPKRLSQARKLRPISTEEITVIPSTSEIDKILMKSINLERLGTSLETKSYVTGPKGPLKVLRPGKFDIYKQAINLVKEQEATESLLKKAKILRKKAKITETPSEIKSWVVGPKGPLKVLEPSKNELYRQAIALVREKEITRSLIAKAKELRKKPSKPKVTLSQYQKNILNEKFLKSLVPSKMSRLVLSRFEKKVLSERLIKAKKLKVQKTKKLLFIPSTSEIDKILMKSINLERLGTSLETKAMIKYKPYLKVLRPAKKYTKGYKIEQLLAPFTLRKEPKVSGIRKNELKSILESPLKAPKIRKIIFKEPEVPKGSKIIEVGKQFQIVKMKPLIAKPKIRMVSRKQKTKFRREPILGITTSEIFGLLKKYEPEEYQRTELESITRTPKGLFGPAAVFTELKRKEVEIKTPKIVFKPREKEEKKVFIPTMLKTKYIFEPTTKTKQKSGAIPKSELKSIFKTVFVTKPKFAFGPKPKVKVKPRQPTKSYLDIIVPPPIVPKFKWAGARPPAKKYKKKGRRRLIYGPSFTARALGYEPIKVTMPQAEKILRGTYSGLEIRRPVEIIDYKKIMKGVMK